MLQTGQMAAKGGKTTFAAAAYYSTSFPKAAIRTPVLKAAFAIIVFDGSELAQLKSIFQTSCSALETMP